MGRITQISFSLYLEICYKVNSTRQEAFGNKKVAFHLVHRGSGKIFISRCVSAHSSQCENCDLTVFCNKFIPGFLCLGTSQLYVVHEMVVFSCCLTCRCMGVIIMGCVTQEKCPAFTNFAQYVVRPKSGSLCGATIVACRYMAQKYSRVDFSLFCNVIQPYSTKLPFFFLPNFILNDQVGKPSYIHLLHYKNICP